MSSKEPETVSDAATLSRLWNEAQSAGKNRDHDQVGLLVRCLEVEGSGEWEVAVRTIAAWALGQLGYESASGPVVRLLAQGESESARAAAADALGEMGDERAIEALQGALDRDTDEVALWSSLALAKIGNAAVDALATGIVRSGGALPRGGYEVDALAKIGTPDAEEALKRTLPLLDEGVRADLLGLLGLRLEPSDPWRLSLGIPRARD